MGLPQRNTKTHTYGEYLTWPDDTRYELIDGEAYAMAPAPTRRHQRLLLEIGRQIADALEGSGCEVNIAPFDVRLPRADEADADITTVVQPDLVVVCDRSKLDDRGCRGAPDWIIEILSPSSAAHDQVRKLALYERQGVREYWLAHPVDRVVTVYWMENSRYARPAVQEMAGTFAARTLEQVVIDWDRIVAALD